MLCDPWQISKTDGSSKKSRNRRLAKVFVFILITTNYFLAGLSISFFLCEVSQAKEMVLRNSAYILSRLSRSSSISLHQFGSGSIDERSNKGLTKQTPLTRPCFFLFARSQVRFPVEVSAKGGIAHGTRYGGRGVAVGAFGRDEVKGGGVLKKIITDIIRRVSA